MQVLAADRGARRRRLGARNYSVTPLSGYGGLIQWVGRRPVRPPPGTRNTPRPPPDAPPGYVLPARVRRAALRRGQLHGVAAALAVLHPARHGQRAILGGSPRPAAARAVVQQPQRRGVAGQGDHARALGGHGVYVWAPAGAGRPAPGQRAGGPAQRRGGAHRLQHRVRPRAHAGRAGAGALPPHARHGGGAGPHQHPGRLPSGGGGHAGGAAGRARGAAGAAGGVRARQLLEWTEEGGGGRKHLRQRDAADEHRSLEVPAGLTLFGSRVKGEIRAGLDVVMWMRVDSSVEWN
mmetsp:Transcript_14605/g.35248  ORF Transcript_14605/g.35248 Transcript_14605/m.35248 type:complete len:293 (-) Transcript_14605:2496-3374(-)